MTNFEKYKDVIENDFIYDNGSLCIVVENERLGRPKFDCPHADDDNYDCIMCRHKLVQWLKEECE